MSSRGAPDQFVARQFDELLELLKANACSFHSCTSLGSTPIPRGIAFRYDIHLRDLEPAHDFLAFHLRQNIPATFFLMWDYSRAERKHLKAFLAFAKEAKAPVELGLHDSPVDAFLIETKFSGNARAYRRWTESAAAVSWLRTLSTQPQALAAFHTDVLERFKQRVEETRKHFGDFTTVASHGGELGQSLRGRTLESPARELAASLVSREWLTQERVAAAGLAVDVEGYKKRVPGWKQVSDGGQSRIAMMETLGRVIGADNRAVQILIHPYAWLKRER